jgi:hypothetical protein
LIRKCTAKVKTDQRLCPKIIDLDQTASFRQKSLTKFSRRSMYLCDTLYVINTSVSNRARVIRAHNTQTMRIFLKSGIFAVLFLSVSLLTAQEAAPAKDTKMGREPKKAPTEAKAKQRPESEDDRMARELELNDEQKAKFKQANREYKDKMKAAKADKKADMKQIREERKAAHRAVLNEAQAKKYDEMQAKRETKRNSDKPGKSKGKGQGKKMDKEGKAPKQEREVKPSKSEKTSGQ